MTAIILRGDAAHLPLPDECVDLLVCSPPYFGLRSYTDNGEHYAGQIGSESTPQEYLEALWACTRDWIRVLKPGGSMFINLGDKYASGDGSGNQAGLAEGGAHFNGGRRATRAHGHARRKLGMGARQKSLLGIPWRYAIGCTDRLGLILRAEVIWQKPNGLPESVTDRVRRAHEQVFHFTKQPRYYAAVDEIREPHAEAQRRGALTWDQRRGRDDQAARYSDQNGHGGTAGMAQSPLGKLPGSVWSIPSAPLQVPARLGVDHFAAFPPALVRPLILGWSPPGVCTGCGEGRRPVVDDPSPVGHVGPSVRDIEANGQVRYGATSQMKLSGGPRMKWKQQHPATITSYVCACGRPDAPTKPAVVLDPFGGTGTTALVATAHGRVGVTVDRSADYCRLAAWRVTDPGERARARDMPKPPPIPDGMEPLFTMEGTQ